MISLPPFLGWYLIFFLLILFLPLQYLSIPALLSISPRYFFYIRFRTFPSWIPPGRVSLFRCSLDLSIGQLNPLALRCSLTRVMGIQFRDVSNLLDGTVLVKIPLYSMSQALFR